MRPCTRVGIDVTWRCNWRCAHCFYLRNPRFHKPEDIPVGDVKAKIDVARSGGLDHVVMVGYGEPSLASTTLELLLYCREVGMATSMITNASTGLERFQNAFACGLDHLHISSHGTEAVLGSICGMRDAWRRQQEVKDWLAAEGLPYRMNLAMQRLNLDDIEASVAQEIAHGCRHYVFLGFLPHYEWAGDRALVRSVAVPPAELRPRIEAGADALLAAGVPMTIRYHPMCHLAPRYWPYVVNARYVFFDPWEWNYELQTRDVPALWRASVSCGESVACHQPCDQCLAYRHCGGWNVRCAAAFDGAGLCPIREVPAEYAAVWERDGGLHDLNPANQMTGTFRPVPERLTTAQADAACPTGAGLDKSEV